MTMRNPLDREIEVARPKFDPAKNYRYTWPGQPPKMVSGEELAAICKGADPSQLAIEEVTAASKSTAPAAEKAPEKK